jgi:hypothetical protein
LESRFSSFEKGKGEMPPKRILVIDPGLSNLVASVFDLHENTICWLVSRCYHVGKDFVAMSQAVEDMHLLGRSYSATAAYCEYQAPIGMVAASRWNIYVEGAICTGLRLLGWEVFQISMAAAKRHLGLTTGNYGNNKIVALKYAKSICPEIPNHHVADCFIMAKYIMDVDS